MSRGVISGRREMKIELILILFFISAALAANKYSEEENNSPKKSGREFKMFKVHQLWQKAQKKLSGHRLADLYAELKIQDKLEAEIKKLKASNLDKDGLKEAEVTKRYLNIVGQYGLGAHFEDHPVIDNKILTGELKDKKLQKIWKQAVYSGFSEEELEKLKEEFTHHQMKVDEYNTLKDELVHLEDFSENSVEQHKDKKFEGQSAKEKNKQLKMKFKEVKHGYEKLEKISFKDYDKVPEFIDQRVYQLWAVAKKSNMSQDELDSLKEELKHFEHRIKKHEYMKEMVSISQKSLEGEVKNGEYPQKHQELEEKANKYGHKVKKIYNELQTRINKAISHRIEL